jgi:hypothetical protein
LSPAFPTVTALAKTAPALRVLGLKIQVAAAPTLRWLSTNSLAVRVVIAAQTARIVPPVFALLRIRGVMGLNNIKRSPYEAAI